MWIREKGADLCLWLVTITQRPCGSSYPAGVLQASPFKTSHCPVRWCSTVMTPAKAFNQLLLPCFTGCGQSESGLLFFQRNFLFKLIQLHFPPILLLSSLPFAIQTVVVIHHKISMIPLLFPEQTTINPRPFTLLVWLLISKFRICFSDI